VLLQHQQQPVFPGIRGIDVNTEASVIPLDEHLIRGDVEDLDDYTVFLGASMARSIGADMGDAVEIYTPLMLERIKEDAILLPRELEVAGIIETGRHEIDARAVIVTIRLMQELYALGDGIHGVALRLEKNAPPAQVVADRLNQNLAGENRALPWYQLNREFLFIIGLERTMSLFVTIVILLVATFSITVSLMMSVIRKTREIGLLVAMGGRPREVAWSYTLQGFFIGISGSITGLLLAMFLLNFRVPIMNAFMMLTNSRDAVLQAYGFANLPIHYNASQIIFALVFAVILSTLAGLLPAWRASRLKPADALRSD
jgi:lipoprotein-releasing system permease protein